MDKSNEKKQPSSMTKEMIFNSFNNREAKKLIELKNLTKSFNGQMVLKGINLTINENEFVTLLGPSGCGKTTTLRIIGGFENQTEGQVYFEDEEISELPAHKRKTNTVFQRYALFPHYNVYDNIAFGLRIKKVAESIIEEKVKRMLKMVELSGFEKREITDLSGGQQQRVAIARALVNEPKVLLLDEPLGALDLKLRKEMQYELKAIQQNTGITFIFVTHDQEEALTMSDKIVIMNEGNILQIGTPEEIYNDPINRFVAEFVGESNLIEGIFVSDNLVEFDGVKFECDYTGFNANDEVDIVLRPEDIDMIDPASSKLTGAVESVIFKGVHYEIDVKTDSRVYTIHTTDFAPIGKQVGLTFQREDIHVMEKM